MLTFKISRWVRLQLEKQQLRHNYYFEFRRRFLNIQQNDKLIIDQQIVD